MQPKLKKDGTPAKPRGGAREGSGRKKLELDEDTLYRMASLGMPKTEIATLMKIRHEHLSRDERWVEIYNEGRANLKQNLRQTQIRLALNGNIPLLIFLGKNMLGQADKVEEQSDTTVTYKWKGE